jgi:hypothetical protein
MIMHSAKEIGCLPSLIAYRNTQMKESVLSNTTDDMTLTLMKDSPNLEYPVHYQI